MYYPIVRHLRHAIINASFSAFSSASSSTPSRVPQYSVHYQGQVSIQKMPRALVLVDVDGVDR